MRHVRYNGYCYVSFLNAFFATTMTAIEDARSNGIQ
jgi:hypothetical protein